MREGNVSQPLEDGSVRTANPCGATGQGPQKQRPAGTDTARKRSVRVLRKAAGENSDEFRPLPHDRTVPGMAVQQVQHRAGILRGLDSGAGDGDKLSPFAQPKFVKEDSENVIEQYLIDMGSANGRVHTSRKS